MLVSENRCNVVYSRQPTQYCNRRHFFVKRIFLWSTSSDAGIVLQKIKVAWHFHANKNLKKIVKQLLQPQRQSDLQVDIGLQLTWDVAEEYYYAHFIQPYSCCCELNVSTLIILARQWESVVKGDNASEWGNRTVDPLPRTNLIVTKSCTRDYVLDALKT